MHCLFKAYGAEKCIIWAFILKAQTGTCTSFASGKLLLRVCWFRALGVALGPRRAFHWSTWCPLIRQHFSSVIVLELMSFQRATETTAACANLSVFFIARSSFSSRLTFFFFCARCSFWLGHLCVGRAHGVESISCRRGFPKAPLIYLIIFQEVTYYFGRRGWGVCFCTSAVGGLYDGCAAVKQLACPVHTSAGHHESREPDSEVWYCDSTPGFICPHIGVWQPALQICWR